MHYMASLVASAALAVLASSADIASSSWSTEFPAIRSYSYVGGRYADNGAGGHVFVDQMYVERLQPTGGIQHSTPIIFIHGQAQTGTVSSNIVVIPPTRNRISTKASTHSLTHS